MEKQIKMEIHGAKTGIKNLTGTELSGHSERAWSSIRRGPCLESMPMDDCPLSPEQDDWKSWTRNRLNLKKSFTIKISTLHNSSDVLHECKARYDSYPLLITNDSWPILGEQWRKDCPWRTIGRGWFSYWSFLIRFRSGGRFWLADESEIKFEILIS